jgi:TetR/AcrR family transcriptional repressor of nem operon
MDDVRAEMGTRERIIRTGATIIHRKGFNNTGIKQILDETGIPKGSFYFYFKNKEDFGLQVVDHFNGQFEDMTRKILEDTSMSPLTRLQTLLKSFMDFFTSASFTCGCPVGNLSQEMADLSPAFREKLQEAIDKMADIYTTVLLEAREAGEIPPDMDVREAAYFIIAGWHGALIRMKVTKNIEPLENHYRFVFEHLLAT